MIDFFTIFLLILQDEYAMLESEYKACKSNRKVRTIS